MCTTWRWNIACKLRTAHKEAIKDILYSPHFHVWWRFPVDPNTCSLPTAAMPQNALHCNDPHRGAESAGTGCHRWVQSVVSHALPPPPEMAAVSPCHSRVACSAGAAFRPDGPQPALLSITPIPGPAPSWPILKELSQCRAAALVHCVLLQVFPDVLSLRPWLSLLRGFEQACMSTWKDNSVYILREALPWGGAESVHQRGRSLFAQPIALSYPRKIAANYISTHL